MEHHKKVLIFYPQSSDWFVAVKVEFDYFQIFEYILIFEYIREYFLRILFLFVFLTQGVKNNSHIRISIIDLWQLIFIFVFVHQKNYSLHSGVNVL